MPLHAKPPKSVWSSEKNRTKIESLQAYAIDNIINEDEKRTAGMVTFLAFLFYFSYFKIWIENENEADVFLHRENSISCLK